MRRFFPRRLVSVLRLSMLLCLLAAGLAMFSLARNTQPGQANFSTPAGDPASVVGPPTLPAATVDSIFASVGSPMVGTGQVVEQAARQANIDDAFALGVWWVETNDGAAGVGSADRNPGSVRASAGFPVAFDGYTIYPSYSAAILDWFNVLKYRYISRGLTTVYAISYPYVGTSSSPLWAGKVLALMQRYHAEAPPPPPLPTTLPKPLHPAIGPSWPRMLTDQAQETVHSAAVPTPGTRSVAPTPASPSALAPVIRDAVVLLGLLVAFALALYALALDGKLPLPIYPRARQQEATPTVTTEQLDFPSISGVAGAPSTFLPAFVPEYSPVPSPAFVSDEPHTIGLLSHTLPLPVAAGASDPAPVPVLASTSGSGMGLLTRYRKMQQGEATSL
jgi:hypothetical protein